MTEQELDEINRRRAAVGKRPLSMSEANSRLSSAGSRVDDPGFDMVGFLIGYGTGFPIGPRGITGEAIVGSMLHPSDTYASSHSPSSDSSSSSSSYDSGSSSSSYDSGSSSSSSDSGGGGGGGSSE